MSSEVEEIIRNEERVNKGIEGEWGNQGKLGKGKLRKEECGKIMVEKLNEFRRGEVGEVTRNDDSRNTGSEKK